MLKQISKTIISVVIFWLAFILSSLNSAIINKIEIIGNDRVSDQTIIVYGDIKVNEDINEQKLNQILNDLYSTDFFEDVKVQIKDNVLIINLKEYSVINKLIFFGEPSNRIKSEIKKNIKSKEKGSFIKSYISQDIETIKSLYSSIGYNFSKIEAKVNKIDDRNIDLIIDITRGEKTKISSINFIGDKKIRDRRLRDVIASEEDRFYKFISRNTNFSQNLIDLDIRLLKNYYKSLGYYNIRVTSNSAEINDSGNIDLIYSIDAGERYIVNKISTEVDPIFDKELFNPLKKSYKRLIGNFYSPFEVKKILDEIDELIEINNLQFVEHNVEEELADNTISITFNINEGERKLVERINILGNNVTNESVIRSELLIDEGDPFTKLALDKSISKIKSRNIFKNVNSQVKDGNANNLKIIDITVEEKPTGEISAGAGVGTNGGSFAINISENNWLGRGNRLNFEIEVDQESLIGNISYANPNYDFLGNSISYFISSEENDKPDQGYENTVVSTGIKTGFEQYKNIFTNLGITASYDDLRTLSTASSSLKKQSGQFSELSGSYGFKLDTRNRAFMPTSGSVIGFNQTLPIYADKKFIANIFQASKYKSFSEDVVGAAKFYLSSINGLDNEDVRLSKRVKLSSKRLRGFEKNKVGPIDGNDHVGGNYAAALNFEANLPKLLPENSNTDIGLFLDFGNVWGVDYDSGIDKSNKIRSSTGIAASWLSPLGPMTFIFSTNLSKASTDKTESFNFNLGTTF